MHEEDNQKVKEVRKNDLQHVPRKITATKKKVRTNRTTDGKT